MNPTYKCGQNDRVRKSQAISIVKLIQAKKKKKATTEGKNLWVKWK